MEHGAVLCVVGRSGDLGIHFAEPRNWASKHEREERDSAAAGIYAVHVGRVCVCKEQALIRVS